ncbi:MAG: ABC transporter ATP-binding protein [Dermabacter sp.]|nr:ABC transporter ATP-binding protein [Dermabacter sp.]
MTSTPHTRAEADGIRLTNVTKSFGKNQVLRGIDLHLEPGKVYGIVGANGVGKTTLMSVICHHMFRSGGQITIDGEDPAENARILERTCFIHEDQRWHDDYKVGDVLKALPAYYPRWQAQRADDLLGRFRVPRQTLLKKLSRGQRSALAISISLASRADYTFLDEPYLGLDPTARVMFYEELVREISEHPRTILMSTHLIDEAVTLMEDVVLMRQGRVAMHGEVESMTARMTTVRGMDTAVAEVVRGREIVSSSTLGRIHSVLIDGELSPEQRARAESLHVSVESPGLQDIVAALGILDHESPTITTNANADADTHAL